jgi:hypothetical protein
MTPGYTFAAKYSKKGRSVQGIMLHCFKQFMYQRMHCYRNCRLAMMWIGSYISVTTLIVAVNSLFKTNG